MVKKVRGVNTKNTPGFGTPVYSFQLMKAFIQGVSKKTGPKII